MGREVNDVKKEVLEALKNNKIAFTNHARDMMVQRGITAPDIKYALKGGRNVQEESEQSASKGITYSIHGSSVDGDPLKVVVAFEDDMLVITTYRR